MGSAIAETHRPHTSARRSAWRNLILFLYLLYGILVNVVLFGIPLRAMSLGASEILLGGLVSGFVSTGVVFSFIGAALCDRFGERSLLIIAFGCYTLGLAVGVVAVSPMLLLVSAFTAGVGDMLFTVASMTYLAQLVQDQGKEISISVAFSLLRIGSVAGLTGAGSIAESRGFEMVFIVGFFFSIGGALLSVALPRAAMESRPTATPSQGVLGPFKAAYDLFRRNATVRLVVAITSLGTLGWFTFRSSFYLDYLRRTGMSPARMGLLTSLGSMACIVAPFVYSLMRSRMRPLAAMVIGLLAAGLGLAVTPFLRTAFLIGAVAIPAQMGDYFRMPGVYSLLSTDTDSEDRPTAMAMMNTSWAGGALVAGPLWGLIVELVGLSTTFYVAGLVTVIGTVALFRLQRR